MCTEFPLSLPLIKQQIKQNLCKIHVKVDTLV